ncbi:hypothetical protein B296_00021572 [Ensete ventricosum]|uniref:Uncharacterized protein n=1 Tax=Ensete ventricosum TaxID=4639 RepID=A0A426XIU5_ENSVE|nr:hypothetical protein B296_00021572 [Ensete ventricosum]
MGMAAAYKGGAYGHGTSPPVGGCCPRVMAPVVGAIDGRGKRKRYGRSVEVTTATTVSWWEITMHGIAREGGE